MNILLTIGALVLLGTLFASQNALVLYQSQDSVGNEYTIAAFGIAQSIIDEAKLKAFDEQTTLVGVADTSSLTAVASLGKDANAEKLNGTAANPDRADTLTTASPFSAANPGFLSSVKFDDVDDYNGYVRILNKARALEGDTVRVTVAYADAASPNTVLSSRRSFCKKMTVTVSGRYLPAPVTMSFAYTY
jgi:uncharacterized protein (DUF3084 family)